MTTGRLLWGTTWRGGVLGLVAGGILGFVYGLAVLLVLTLADTNSQDWTKFNVEATAALVILGIIFGTLFGAPLGLVAGAMDGFLIGILTRLFFTPLKNARTYRLVIALISGLFTMIVTGLGLYAILNLTSVVLDTGVLLLAITVPAIIAGIAAALISILITRWYIKESVK